MFLGKSGGAFETVSIDEYHWYVINGFLASKLPNNSQENNKFLPINTSGSWLPYIFAPPYFPMCLQLQVTLMVELR
jgi:hypothetical protein